MASLSDILRQNPLPINSFTFSKLGLPSKGFFLVSHLNDALKMQTTSGDTPKVARYDKGENYELFWFGSLSFPDYVYILCPKELFVKGFL